MTTTNEAKVRLSKGEVACEIVADGELIFSRRVPQYELWRVRSQLRQRADIHVELRLLAMQQLERIEADIYGGQKSSPAAIRSGIDWVGRLIVGLNIIVCLVLIGWTLIQFLSSR